VVTFYPASGRRDQLSGAFINTGSYSYWWSSAVSGANACCLRFFSAEVGPSYGLNRTCGLPVRCVQYLQ
jgi:hypothetical protein